MPRSTIAIALILLATAGFAGIGVAADPATLYDLRSGYSPGDAQKVELLLEAKGDLLLREDHAIKKHTLAVGGRMAYEERLIDLGDDTLAGRKGLRNYSQAQATIEIDGHRMQPELTGERRLIGVERQLDGTLFYCPTTLLTRDDLDLLEVPGNSLMVEGLLPNGKVAIGDSWPVTEQVLAALLDLDAVSTHEVKGTLSKVEGTKAKVDIAGTVSGAVAGVATEVEVKAKAVFDLESARLTWVALLTKEKRSIGHVGPGLELTARLQMKVVPAEQPELLADEVLEQLPEAPAPELLQLEFRSDSGYAFAYDRRWHVISQSPESAIFRLVDRGDMVAQANVSLVTATADRPTSLESFRAQVEQSLGKSIEQIVEASEGKTSSELTINKVVAQGKVDGLAVEWHYYLVTGPNGRQVVFAFTMEADAVARLGELDAQMASSIEFAKQGEPTAADPSNAKARG
ncbi:MAG: hypothetical protein K1X74_03040 [Pirellulales bacterium]|nr:hypothetical protein [Pirellulales bacterium]